MRVSRGVRLLYGILLLALLMAALFAVNPARDGGQHLFIGPLFIP